jgi:hypothetical protein
LPHANSSREDRVFAAPIEGIASWGSTGVTFIDRKSQSAQPGFMDLLLPLKSFENSLPARWQRLPVQMFALRSERRDVFEVRFEPQLAK